MSRDTGSSALGAGPAAVTPFAVLPGVRPESTRDRILDIALDLFTRKGYTETSLREIGAALGISKAALYYHFASKQAILLALHERVHDLSDSLPPLLRSEGIEGDGLKPLIDVLIGLALQHRRLIELHLRNWDAITAVHRDAVAAAHLDAHRETHGSAQPSDLESYLRHILSDSSLNLDQRVRRIASVSAIVGVLLGAGVFPGVPDAEIELALRRVVHDLLAVGLE